MSSRSCDRPLSGAIFFPLFFRFISLTLPFLFSLFFFPTTRERQARVITIELAANEGGERCRMKIIAFGERNVIESFISGAALASVRDVCIRAHTRTHTCACFFPGGARRARI